MIDNGFKIICNLIAKQAITYEEAFELLYSHFESRKNYLKGEDRYIDATTWVGGVNSSDLLKENPFV